MRPWVIIVLVFLSVLLWLFGAGRQLSGGSGKSPTVEEVQPMVERWFRRFEGLIPEPDPLTLADIESLSGSCGTFPELSIAANGACAISVRKDKNRPRRSALITPLAGTASLVFQPPRGNASDSETLSNDGPEKVPFGADGGAMTLSCTSGPCRVRLVK